MSKIMLIIAMLMCFFIGISYGADSPIITNDAKLPTIKVNPKDGAEMVLIPAGEFLMGTPVKELAELVKEREDWLDYESPQRKVYLDAYYIYKTEVTVAQYKKFCEATKHKMPEEPEWKWKDNNPIINVTWKDANAYAKWAGVMLPTDAQWEKAARGTDGRKYPWGNVWDAKKCVSSFGKEINKTSPVGSILAGASPYGVLDMAGNVYEWCADWYKIDYYKNAPVKNPNGPTTGSDRIVRGGSWRDVNPKFLRSAVHDRFSPDTDMPDFGFRCAVMVDDSLKTSNETSEIVKPIAKDSGIKIPVTMPVISSVIKVNLIDGAEMVQIPAGEFLMGTSKEVVVALLKNNPDYMSEWFDDQLPQRKVTLDTYYIYKTEVTVAQYRKFCEATKRNMPDEPEWKWKEDNPIVNVTWDDANSYAKWAGAELPSEAQWEKAARGTDGREYPWGNEWDSSKCNNSVEKENDKTSVVGSYRDGASPYGVLDMAGNVWEWCADWYDFDYYNKAPLKNPPGPVKGEYRVIRGGAWKDDQIRTFRTARRYGYCFPEHKYIGIGFRCAMKSPVK